MKLSLMPPNSMVSTSMSRPIQSGRLILRLRNWMSSRVMLPLMPLRMAPLGDLVASGLRLLKSRSGCLRSISSSCWRLTVIPAFFTPTPWRCRAAMASITAWPLVIRRCSADRSISSSWMSRRAATNFSRICSKATWAISSPWRMTKGDVTLILLFIDFSRGIGSVGRF